MSDKKSCRMVGAGSLPADLVNTSELTVQLEQSLFAALVEQEERVGDAFATEPDDDSCQWNNAFPEWDGAVVRIVDWKAAERGFASRMARTSPMETRRLTTVMETLRARGDYRKLAGIPQDWRERLNVVEENFPNFSRVIDYLRGAYALAERKNGVPTLSPILLVGPPGIGKSLFADHVARHLGSGLVTLRMETAQSNSALSGSAEYWGNTKPGEVFTTLLEQDFGNPVFFLDEIDKAASGDHDPLTSLYALLEPTTAKKFADLSYPWLELDASHIVWLCTANNPDCVPAPLLDRLRQFDIDPPTTQQTRKLVRVMFDNLLEELAAEARVVRLTAKAVDMLASMSPRQARQALREGVGRALYQGRSRVLVQDIPHKQEQVIVERRMGFLS